METSRIRLLTEGELKPEAGWVRYVNDSSEAAAGFTSLLVSCFREVFGRFLSFRHYLRLTSEQIYLLGFRSLPLVIVTGAAVGYIMAIQAGNEIQRFGGTAYLPIVISISVFRELGPMLSSLLLAGRVGSGITAELSSMKVTKQIDALRALSTSPISTLAVPRILACVIVFPMLTIVADFVSAVAAMLYCKQAFGMNNTFYYHSSVYSLTYADLFTGVGKTAVFGLMVSVHACWKGLSATGGTKGVGDATTWVVVISSLSIMISDVVMSKIFILMGLFP